jgi:hypothetical protein
MADALAINEANIDLVNANPTVLPARRNTMRTARLVGPESPL